MRVQKYFLIIAIVYMAGFIAHAGLLKKTVYGDGVFYYSWVKSAVVDHDLNFSDEYAHFQASQPQTALSLPGNKYSVGPAILWSPWFAWTHTLVKGSGYELPYQIIVGLSGVQYSLTGLVLLFLLLKKYFSETVSLAAIAATAGATNLLFYGSLDTVNSHAVSFFAAVLFLTFLFQQKRNWFLIGMALGIVGLMRTQDVIIGILILPFIKPKNILHFLSGAFFTFLPQMAAWQLLYGKFWVSPYVSNIEGFNLLQPRILEVLFSPTNGLITWTPAVILGFYGLEKANVRLPTRLMAIAVLLQIYIVASWSIWWQGASYSGRMFVSVLPLLAFGLAVLFTQLAHIKFRNIIMYWGIILPLCAINALMIVYFLLTH